MRTKTQFIDIQWQSAPASETGGTPNGASIEDVARAIVRVLEHRNSEVPCAENRKCIEHARAIVALQEARQADRIARGVEGMRDVP